MIKPKDKAKNLFFEMLYYYNGEIKIQRQSIEKAKQCALIAVENEYNAKIQAYNEMAEFCIDVASQAVIYTERERAEVKQEIIKL